MRSRYISVVAVASLLIALLAFSGAGAADDATPEPRLGAAGCRAKLFPANGGTAPMYLPAYCRDGKCEIFVHWFGEDAGAFGQGLTFDTNFMQFSGDNYWAAGPALSIAGAQISGGEGFNGDPYDEAIHGPYQTPDGSYFVILDDSRKERIPDKVSLQLWHADRENRQIYQATAYICTD